MNKEAGDGDAMTLAFALDAFKALAYPEDVFADARQWSQYTGVVADDAHAVESAVRRHDIHQDFEIGELDTQSVLSRLKWEANTERYVFVGNDETDRELAEYVKWEYRPVEKAAEEADWRLKKDLSHLERIWRWLTL